MKGSDGGLQTSDDGGQQVGGDDKVVTVASMRADMGRRLLQSVTSHRSSPQPAPAVPVPPVTTGRQPTVATCHHPSVTTSSPITSAPSPPAWHHYHRFPPGR